MAEFEQVVRAPLAKGGSFALRAEIGAVEVRRGDGAEAVVTLTADRSDFAEHFEIRLDASSPERVAVAIERTSSGSLSWHGGGQSSRIHIDVQLPASTATDLETSGGKIEVAELTGTVRARSSGGGLRGENLGGELDLASSGGATRVSLAKGNDRGGKIESSGGKIEVAIDAGVGLTIDAVAKGGSIHCDLPIAATGSTEKRALRGTLNSGGSKLELRTSGGSIHISAR